MPRTTAKRKAGIAERVKRGKHMTDSGDRNAGGQDDSRGPVIFGAILFVIVIAVAVYFAVYRDGNPDSKPSGNEATAAGNAQ